jgi:hypothetical protein
MAYGIVNTELMSGTKQPADLLSLKYQVAGTDTAIENGRVVLVGVLATGEREIRLATVPAANSALNAVALIASPELMFDERKVNLDEFRNEAGEISRGYRFRSGNIFGVTAEALDNNTAAGIVVGKIVELQATNQLAVVDALTGESTQVGTICDIYVVGTKTFYAVQVV